MICKRIILSVISLPALLAFMSAGLDGARVLAQMQEPPAYIATLQKLGATPEEIGKFEKMYAEAPDELKKIISSNNPDILKNMLEHNRAEWAGEMAHPLLSIGSAMPSFELVGVDGKTYSPESVKDAKLVVIFFISNHCPASQMHEAREQRLVNDYRTKGVAFLAIQPDAPAAAAPSELGYTDVKDDLDGMKDRASFRKFNFPYLYDGDAQAAAKVFGPKATPHVFIFDSARKLRYEGRFDDNLIQAKARTHEVRDAIDALLAGKEVAVKHTPVFGCSIKWGDHMQGAARERKEWAALPVTVDPITLPQLTALRKTVPENILIINFWATWCGPCKVEMPDILETYQWYKTRGVDLVTVSVDNPSNKAAVVKFLQRVHSPAKNLQVNTDDLFAVQSAFDSQWQSGVPYTLVLDAKGQTIYRQEGELDILKLRRTILAHLDDAGGFAGNADYWKN